MKKILQGNIALCEGAIDGGLDAYYAYPITPQMKFQHILLRFYQS